MPTTLDSIQRGLSEARQDARDTARAAALAANNPAVTDALVQLVDAVDRLTRIVETYAAMGERVLDLAALAEEHQP